MKQHIKDSKDHLGELLVNAYKDLWDANKALAFKIEAVDIIARFIDHKDTRERLEYFYAREQHHFLKQMMKEVLEGNYLIDSYEEVQNTSPKLITNKSEPIKSEDMKTQISLYKNIYRR